MIRNSQPLPWRARGVSDSVDGSTSFNGAMASLSNLIPDPTTAQLWECRPAAIARATFTGFTVGAFSAGFSSGFFTGATGAVGLISALKVIGSIAYGMIGQGDGNDHPFAFNLGTNSFLTITNAAGAVFPVSQAALGPWTPPIMDVIGANLIVTHIGFQTRLPANAFGWFDITTPTAPVWHTGNLQTGTTTTFFTAVPPTGVAQFYNRAYYIYNLPAQPALIASDVIGTTNSASVPACFFMTTTSGTGTQILTLGDATPLSALGQLRFYNQLGGIIQGLVVFKGATNTYQITGDFALNNLALNSMNLATGTLAPLSVISTPRGLGFISPDGFRIIDFQSNISDPIGMDGQGVTAPFIYTAQPSRICAACNGNVIRITSQNTLAAGSPAQEFWYDLGRQIWHGPHTFPASVIQPFIGTFIMAAVGVPGILWESDPVQNNTSTFIENGTQMAYTYQTVFLPDTDQMGNISVAQTLLQVQFGTGLAPLTLACSDQNGTLIDTVSAAQIGTPSIWGQFNWGQAVWGSPATALVNRIVPWRLPLVFSKAQFLATGQSAAAIRLGAWHFRYKQLRYLLDFTAAA